MAEINLYPSGKSQKISWYSFEQAFRSINLVVTVLFFIITLVFVALIVLNQNAINQAKARQEEYRNKIKALSQVESQYVFIKDRVRKSSEILQSRQLVERLEEFNTILKSVNGVSLDDVEFNQGKFLFSATVLTYSDLERLLSAIQEIKSYEKGVINSLGFTPQKGYQLEVKLE
ncbi:MAG: hypothetical protein KatS3mg088_602 [Patescibacteria group bacterium]|nr:MAG: hypothetical protein KatS3mg088_602 [Patescibacteria group bacterium]